MEIMASMPSVFISHGPPTTVVDGGPTAAFLAQLSRELDKPRAILCISAHWETAAPAVSTAVNPQTICDFYGFPDALYEISYPAPGARDVAVQAASALTAAGLACACEPGQGLDHGTWVPLALMYPAADIPVAQVAIQPELGPAHHVEIGKALAPPCEDGILILGSGNITHNLGDALAHMRSGNPIPPTPEWASAFDDWVAARIASGDVDALVDYLQQAPHAITVHPRDDHFLPLFTAIGAAEDPRGRQCHAKFMFGSLSQAAYIFD